VIERFWWAPGIYPGQTKTQTETDKGNSVMSRVSSVKCNEKTIYSFIAILSAKAECMHPSVTSFFFPSISNNLLCSA